MLTNNLKETLFPPGLFVGVWNFLFCSILSFAFLVTAALLVFADYELVHQTHEQIVNRYDDVTPVEGLSRLESFNDVI